MICKIEVPEYSDSGIKVLWEAGFTIETQISDDKIYLRANAAGLISLARHCLTLAQKQVPTGHHVHYDESNSLEEGSKELIVMKVEA